MQFSIKYSNIVSISIDWPEFAVEFIRINNSKQIKQLYLMSWMSDNLMENWFIWYFDKHHRQTFKTSNSMHGSIRTNFWQQILTLCKNCWNCYVETSLWSVFIALVDMCQAVYSLENLANARFIPNKLRYKLSKHKRKTGISNNSILMGNM